MRALLSEYPDSQAVEDGVLVELGPQNRMTRALYEWLSTQLADLDTPPPEQPVALAIGRGWIGRDGPMARRTWDENIGGGDIHALKFDGRVIWMIPNKLGGLTLLFPEEY